jgi:hypothetical protein
MSLRDSPATEPTPRLELFLFGAGLLVYALTRFIGLTRFPIYFFCDEALQANLAGDLVRNGFRDSFGVFLPPYFLNDQRWDLSLSVYLHALPVALLGKSVALTRGTEVVVNLLAPLAVAVILREAFRVRSWWTAPFVLAAIPTWFLHSRTAFQPAMTASFFAAFLASYLLYRCRSPRWIFAAVAFGAATFYSYTAGQGLMLICGVLLLLSDWRYHVSQRPKLLAGAVVLLLLVAVPYVRYRVLHRNVVRDQLQVLQSYWIRPIPLEEKLGIFAKNYVRGLEPVYWFTPDRYDLERHRMKGMGFLPRSLAPLALIGLVVCVVRVRSPAHRVALIAPLGVPFAAAAASIGIMRVLSMVVPFTLFTCIGMEALLGRLRDPRWRGAISIGLAMALSAGSLWMMRTALVEGPTWYRNYGLYGMQYGSSQVFGAIREELERSPNTKVRLSPTWANNPNAFVHYFLTDWQKPRVSFGNMDPWTQSKKELDPNLLFVLTPLEYAAARAGGKFVLRVNRTLPYPDGTTGFYFARVRYSDRIDALLDADLAERRRLVETTAVVQGEPAVVRHSPLGLGQVSDALDGKPDTLVRGAQANPFVLEFEFPDGRSVSGVVLDVGTMDFRLRVELQSVSTGKPLVFTGDFSKLGSDPHLDFAFPRGPHRVSRARIEISNVGSGETAEIHVRDVAFR